MEQQQQPQEQDMEQRAQTPYLPYLIVSAVFCILMCMGFLHETQSWYEKLSAAAVKVPHMALFPAWACAYTALALSAYSVHKRQPLGQERLLLLYGVTALLGLLWNNFFFVKHNFTAAIICVFAMAALVAVLLKKTSKKQSGAMYLLLVYEVWSMYLIALNYCAVMLN